MANREEFITEFISIYRQHRSLWQIKSREYSDRRLREKGYQKLLEFFRTVDPEANIDSVKKKINNIRSCFRKEFKKIRESKKSGISTDSIYKPSLWYFNLMLFTVDQEEPRTSISNDTDDIQEEIMEDTENEGSDYNLEEISSPPPTETGIATENIDTPRSMSAASTSSTTGQSNLSYPKTSLMNKKYKVCKDVREELLAQVGKQLEMSEDEFDITGKHIGNKLRSLPKETAIIAEKLMMDVLFQAQLGYLNRTSTLVTTPTAIREAPAALGSDQQRGDNYQWLHGIPSSQSYELHQPQQHKKSSQVLNEFLTFDHS